MSNEIITDFIKGRVAQIKTKGDFDAYIASVKKSSAPLEQRDSVMKYAKLMHPHFEVVDKKADDKFIQNMRDGEADTYDIEGFSA